MIAQLRQAVRSLRRAPGFALLATLTLALGIGLSTAVFTVADALLLRELPVTDQERVVTLWGETKDGRFANFPLSLDDARDFRRRSRTVADVAHFGFRGASPVPVRIGGQDGSLQASLVSGNWFDVLGSRALLGRALRPEDDVAGATPVLVLSHRAWRQRFGGDPAVVGRRITDLQGGREHTIVGVMPPGLEYPRGTDAWAPLVAWGAANGILAMVTGELDMLARLRPGATPAQAREELTRFFAREGAPAWHKDVRGVAHPLREVVLGDARPAVLVVTLAAALLLFVTCVNVANLLLVRALGRGRELVVRSALGAGRGRLVAQALAESAALAIAGGAAGVLLAMAGVRAFTALAPAGMPRLDEVGVDGTAMVAALAFTTLAMLLSGVAPAAFGAGVRAHDALRAGSRTTGVGRVRRAAEGLVVAQVALAAVSLVAAALVGRSLVRLQGVDLAFAPERLLVATMTMRQDRLAAPPEQRAALDAVLERTRALPGVRDVAPAFASPFAAAGGGIDGRLPKPGQGKEEAAENPVLNMEVAAPNHFAVLGVPLRRGRTFRADDREGAPPVIVVSESVARHYWPGADAVGQRLAMGPRELTVVGVVADTRYRELTTPRATVYFPLAQSPFPMVPTTLLVRTAGDPGALVPALRRAIAESSPGTTMVTATPLEVLLDAPRAQPRLNAGVLALFAAAAVLLAAIGLFAVVATMVRQRTHELGIRMALGATAADVRRLVLGRGLALAGAGAALGLAGALAAGRLVSSLLYETSPTDAPTLAAVVATLLVVAAIASLLPARVGARVDPARVLRGDG